MWRKLTNNLMVDSVDDTVAYYRDQLGFELLMSVPEEPPFQWAMMRRDGVELMFQDRENLLDEVPELADRPLGGSQTFYVETENVQDMADLVSRHNPKALLRGPYQTFYGTTEIQVRDPNGYIFTFSQGNQ